VDLNLVELLPDTSRRTADIARNFILKHPGYLKPMLELSYSHDHMMAMRSSRVVYLCFERDQSLLFPYFEEIAERIPALTDSSAIRNLLHLFIGHLAKLSEEHMGKLVDFCFRHLEDPASKTAPRALCMELILEASEMIPELQTALKGIVEMNMENPPGAIRSKIRKIELMLNKKVLK